MDLWLLRCCKAQSQVVASNARPLTRTRLSASHATFHRKQLEFYLRILLANSDNLLSVLFYPWEGSWSWINLITFGDIVGGFGRERKAGRMEDDDVQWWLQKNIKRIFLGFSRRASKVSQSLALFASHVSQCQQSERQCQMKQFLAQSRLPR